MNDGNIFDDTAITERDHNNLTVHSGFRLIARNLLQCFGSVATLI